MTCVSKQPTVFVTLSASTPDGVAWQQEKMLWCVCSMESLGRDSNHYDTIIFVRRWLLVHIM